MQSPAAASLQSRHGVPDRLGVLLAFQRQWPAYCLGLCVGVAYFLSSPVAGDFWWFDASRHAMNSVFVHDVFAQGGWKDPIRFAKAYYDQYPGINIGFYPPFLYLVTAPFLGVFGVSHATCQAVVSGFAALCAMAGYAWTRPALGRLGACAAGVMLVVVPEMALWGRQVQLDVPAVALLLWGVWALVKWLAWPRDRWLWLAALLLGCAMLTRVQTLFVWPLWLAVVGLHPVARAQRWRVRLGATALYGLLSLPSVAAALYFAKVMGSLAGKMPDMPDRWSWANWGWYAARMPDQLGFVGTAVLLLGLLLLIEQGARAARGRGADDPVELAGDQAIEQSLQQPVQGTIRRLVHRPLERPDERLLEQINKQPNKQLDQQPDKQRSEQRNEQFNGQLNEQLNEQHAERPMQRSAGRNELLPMAGPGARRLALWMALSTALLAWLFFSLVSNKEPRFALPVLPFAMLAALLAIASQPTAVRLGALGWMWPRVLAMLMAAGMGAEAWTTQRWADVPRVAGHRDAALLAAQWAAPNSRVMISAHRDGNFIFALRAWGQRPDLAVRRADKLLVDMTIMRQLGIQDRGLNDDDIRRLLDRERVSVVVAQSGYLGDQPSMQALDRLLDADCCFELRQTLRIDGQHRADETALRVYVRRTIPPIPTSLTNPANETNQTNQTSPANPANAANPANQTNQTNQTTP